jgi:hypothetical protein
VIDSTEQPAAGVGAGAPPKDAIEQIVDAYLEKINVTKKVEDQKKGKPLGDYVAVSNSYTTAASTVNRSLALGGIAIIWIFKRDDVTHSITPGVLNLPLLFLAISLALDMFQYFVAGIAWTWFYERKYWLWKHKKEFKAGYAQDIPAPNVISIPLYGLWFLKILFMGLAYWKILCYLSYHL